MNFFEEIKRQASGIQIHEAKLERKASIHLEAADEETPKEEPEDVVKVPPAAEPENKPAESDSLFKMKYPGWVFTPDMTAEQIKAVANGMGECTILDFAARHLMTMDGEELRLIDDHKHYWPALIEEAKSKGATWKQLRTIEEVGDLAEKGTVPSFAWDALLESLIPFVSHKDLLEKEYAQWEYWWDLCTDMAPEDILEMVQRDATRHNHH